MNNFEYFQESLKTDRNSFKRPYFSFYFTWRSSELPAAADRSAAGGGQTTREWREEQRQSLEAGNLRMFRRQCIPKRTSNDGVEHVLGHFGGTVMVFKVVLEHLGYLVSSTLACGPASARRPQRGAAGRPRAGGDERHRGRARERHRARVRRA